MATSSITLTQPRSGWRHGAIPGTRARAITAHIAANVIWAGSAVASKPLLDTIPPLTLAAIRVAIAFALLRLVLAHRGERPATGRVPAVLGLTGVALFCGGMNLGLLFVEASVTSLLGGLIPLLTILLAAVILGERPGGRRIAGVIISIAGIAVIVLAGHGGARGVTVLETLLPLGSALGSALYMVLGRRAMMRQSSIAVVTGSTGYGLLFLLPGTAYEMLTVGAKLPSVTDALLLLYLGAGCSGIAFLLRGYGLANLGASHGAIYGNLRPVLGVALAVVLLREPLAGNVIGGGLLVLAGVAIASRRSRGITHRGREQFIPRLACTPSRIGQFLPMCKDRASGKVMATGLSGDVPGTGLSHRHQHPATARTTMNASHALLPFSRVQHSFLLDARTTAILALIGANIIWGGSAAASKPLVAVIPPLTMASMRVAIALVVLTLILRRRHERIATGTAPALLGLTGVALFCACQNLGLRFADATTTALIGAAIPVLTAGFAVILLGERLSAARMAGIMVSIAGVGVIMLVGKGLSGGAATAGNLLPLASAVAFAAYNILGRRTFGQGNALALVAGSTRYGLLFLLPAAVLELARGNVGQVSTRDGLLLLYLGAGCSAVAFMLCGYGLSHLEAGHGAVFGNLKPLVGVALSMSLLGEPLAINQVIGGVLVLAGVGIAGQQRSRAARSVSRADRQDPTPTGDPTRCGALPTNPSPAGPYRFPMPVAYSAYTDTANQASGRGDPRSLWKGDTYAAPAPDRVPTGSPAFAGPHSALAWSSPDPFRPDTRIASTRVRRRGRYLVL